MNGIIRLGGYILLMGVLIIFSVGFALIILAPVFYLTFANAQIRAAKVSRSLSTTLMPNEKLIAELIQFRVFALLSRRIALAITDSRIIVIRRGLLGGFTMQDIQWKDLRDVTIAQNVWASVCGSNLQFKHSDIGVGLIEVEGVDCETASVIYSKSQFEEQAWEEKRRMRKIEEVRAAAGGVVVNTSQPDLQPRADAGSNSVLVEIQKAKELLDMGAVSDSEFQEMKSRILSRT